MTKGFVWSAERPATSVQNIASRFAVHVTGQHKTAMQAMENTSVIEQPAYILCNRPSRCLTYTSSVFVPDKLRIAMVQDALLDAFNLKTKPRRKDQAAGQLNVQDGEMSLNWVQASHSLLVI